MGSSSSDHINIFVSYSHKDKEHLARLKVHLAPYIDGKIEEWLWDDTQIQTGLPWRIKIDEALRQASAAILLISADFMASRFIGDNELPPLLEAVEKNGIPIIPVILSPCGFEEKKNLSQFQAAHILSETLSSMKGNHKKELWWTNVASNINSAIVAQKAKHISSDTVQTQTTVPTTSILNEEQKNQQEIQASPTSGIITSPIVKNAPSPSIIKKINRNIEDFVYDNTKIFVDLLVLILGAVIFFFSLLIGNAILTLIGIAAMVLGLGIILFMWITHKLVGK